MKVTVQGTIKGFNAGERFTTVQVQPIKPATFLDREEKQAAFLMVLGPNLTKRDLLAEGPVEIEGECARTFREWKDPNTGRMKDLENHRFVILTIKPLKA